MSKRNRITNESVLVMARMKSCEACGLNKTSEAHHIITKAKLGPDLPFNVMSLCHDDHMFWHDQPLSKFFAKFPHIVSNLEKRGFIIETVFGKTYLYPDQSKISY